MLDDTALLRRYVETQVEADFQELVRRHIDGVYSAALRRLGGDVHLAQDVVQQVFISMARNAPALSDHPVLIGWLYTTTRNQAANAVRTERRRQVREKEAQTMSKISTGSLIEADWGRVAPVLDSVIDQLSESDRAAVLLRFIDRRPFAEIGAALRVSEDAARMRIDRALHKLRLMLKRRGIISSAAALETAMATHAVTAAPAGWATNVAGIAMATNPAIAAAAAGVVKVWNAGSFLSGVAAAIVLAAAIVTTGRVAQLAHQRQEVLAAANLQLASAQEGLQRLLADDQILERKLAALEKTAPAPNAVAAIQVVSAAGPSRPSAGEDSEAHKFLEAFPQARRMIMEAERPHLEQIYAPFFRSAALGRGQKERLEAAMENASLQNLAITAAEGISLSLDNPPAADLGQILGDRAAGEFREYQRLMPGWTLAFGAATEAAYRVVPLSADQTQQLAQIVSANSVSYRDGGTIDLGQVAWDVVLAQAAVGLSSDQSRALKSAVDKVRYQSALAQAWRGQTVIAK